MVSRSRHQVAEQQHGQEDRLAQLNRLLLAQMTRQKEEARILSLDHLLPAQQVQQQQAKRHPHAGKLHAPRHRRLAASAQQELQQHQDQRQRQAGPLPAPPPKRNVSAAQKQLHQQQKQRERKAWQPYALPQKPIVTGQKADRFVPSKSVIRASRGGEISRVLQFHSVFYDTMKRCITAIFTMLPERLLRIFQEHTQIMCFVLRRARFLFHEVDAGSQKTSEIRTKSVSRVCTLQHRDVV